MDADYCAQVIKAIHIMGTPGFSTLMVYDRVSWARISHESTDSYGSASRGSHQSRGIFVQRVRSQELRYVELSLSFCLADLIATLHLTVLRRTFLAWNPH